MSVYGHSKRRLITAKSLHGAVSDQRESLRRVLFSLLLEKSAAAAAASLSASSSLTDVISQERLGHPATFLIFNCFDGSSQTPFSIRKYTVVVEGERERVISCPLHFFQPSHSLTFQASHF